MTKFPVQLMMILIAALSAFTLPEAKSSVREVMQGIFAPVAWPARMLASWATHRLSPAQTTDVLSPNSPRSAEQLRQQNAELLTRLAYLEAQLEELRQRTSQYQRLASEVRKMVQPAAITGGPVDTRQTLTIAATGLTSVKEGMAVATPSGMIGQIFAVATGGATARVLLLTDSHSHVQGQFARLDAPSPGGPARASLIKTPPPILDGNGREMVIRLLAARDVRGKVQVGDAVLLNDAKFPAALQGERLGTVRAINLPPTDAGHAEIVVTPVFDVSRLDEVLVANKP